MRDSSFQSIGTYGTTRQAGDDDVVGRLSELMSTPPRNSASGSSAGSPSLTPPGTSMLPLAKVTVSFRKENRDVLAEFFLQRSDGFFEIFFGSEPVPCITFQVTENQDTVDVVVPSQNVEIEAHSQLLESGLLDSHRVRAIAENGQSQVPALFLISQIVAAFLLFEPLNGYKVSVMVGTGCNIMNVSDMEEIQRHLEASFKDPIFTPTTLHNVHLTPQELSAIILDGEDAPQVTSPQTSFSSPEIESSPGSQSSPDYSDRF